MSPSSPPLNANTPSASSSADFFHELREYVDALRTSSNRTRFALYIVIIATALIVISNWNVQSGNWPERRLHAWYKYAIPVPTEVESKVKLPILPKSKEATGIPKAFFNGDPEQLKTAREEYLKQFASRSVLTSSPIPGVSIDVNDVGVIGGISLILLMLVLFFCQVREYENLYLALYKVRRLAKEPGGGHGGSRANLLYHALAMSQVLGAPPTLARWKGSIRNHVGFIYMIPAIAYAWVLSTNWQTANTGAQYEVNVPRLNSYQLAIALVLVILSATSCLYSRAMSKRWKRAFFSINPTHQNLPQMTLPEWLKLSFRKNDDQLCTRLRSELIDSVTMRPGIAEQEVPIATRRVTFIKSIVHADVKKMVTQLVQCGEGAAQAWCDQDKRGQFEGLLEFTTDCNEILGSEWSVSGTWSFRYAPRCPM